MRSIHLFNFSGDVDRGPDSIDWIRECRHNLIANCLDNRTGMTGNGSSQMRSLNTLTPEIGIPDGGSVLWVFALPDK